MAQIIERETRDQIIEEARAIKARLAEAMDFDIGRIIADARKKQQQSGRQVAAPPIRQSS